MVERKAPTSPDTAGTFPDPGPNARCLASLLFGLLTIWTGLLRGIEAQAYKPKALWFCFAMGLAAITAGFLFRTARPKCGFAAGITSGVIVLGYYLSTFIGAPEEDATIRVGVIIVGAIAYLIALLIPDRSK